MTDSLEKLITHHGVSSKMDMQQDIDDEIEELVCTNCILDGRKPRQRQALDDSVETIYRRLFRSLVEICRKLATLLSNWSKTIWRTGSMMRHIKQRRKALGKQNVLFLACLTDFICVEGKRVE